MSRVLCRLLVVAAVAAAVLACTARAACDAQCKTCELGVCVGCNSGYYLDGQTCTACPGEGCRDCGASGVCTSCMDGYTLTVSVDGNTNTASPVVNGTCRSTAELTCSDTRCKSCVMGRCVACEDGYYLDGQTCTACPVERCRECVAFGVCTSCTDGYILSFLNDDDSKTSSSLAKGACKSTVEWKCSDTRCKNCVGNRCVECKDGYYPTNGTCTSCNTANCAQCEIAGRCITCKHGYRIKLASNATSDSGLNDFGECIDGARVTGAVGAAALVAVVAVLTMLAW